MAIFHLVLRRDGPEWDPSRPMEEQTGPLADERRVVHVVEAESDDAVRATLARDPWSGTHLRVEAIDPWTIRLDGRRT